MTRGELCLLSKTDIVLDSGEAVGSNGVSQGVYFGLL